MKQKYFVSIIGIILLTQNYSSGQVTCDRFSIDAVLVGHKLTFSLDTDLPDQTNLMVSVNRSYWETVDPEEYSETYFSGKFLVSDWREPRAIDVKDSIWESALSKRQNLCARVGMPFRVGKKDKYIEIFFNVGFTFASPS